MKSISIVFVCTNSSHYTQFHATHVRTYIVDTLLLTVLTFHCHTMTTCHCHHPGPRHSYVKEDQFRKQQKELEEVKES